MNILHAPESPKEAARRLAVSAGAIRDGFRPDGLYRYNDADGNVWCYRIRCKHSDGRKWIRPMRREGFGFAIGEPAIPAAGKPLYAPPFPLVDSDPIVIVEGEPCADALAKLGMMAVTSGAADSAKAADWTPLRDRRVLLWPDHDGAGTKYRDAVAGILRGLGCTVDVIDVAALDLPDGGDCVDWLAAHPGATRADIEAQPLLPDAAAPANNNPTTADAPEPLRRPTPPPEPYPVAELGPILAPACASLRRVIQAPDAVCGASLLAAVSLAVQGLADVHHDGRVHPLSLWMLTVAESGERKSAVDAEAMRPARDFERELAREHDAACLVHAAEAEEWAARREAAKHEAKQRKGAGLREAMQRIGPEPPPPLKPTVIAADFTAEGLAKLLAVGRPSVGAFTDEAALVFGGHGMTKETVMRTAATLSKLWDSGTLDRIRASEGASKLWGRRLALHLLAQPVIAERALSDPILAGQGFLARCLLAWPESTAGTRPYRAENLRDDAALRRYAATFADALRRPLPMAEGQRNELDPRPLRLSPDAFATWRTLHDGIEAGMATTGPYASVKPWASKTPEQCLRIAGVLSLLERPDADVIEAPVIERAAELALWHLGEAVRLAGTAELSDEVRDAEALLNWCHETGRTLLYSGDALRFGPARIRERSRFREAVGVLEGAGWGRAVEGGAVVDGAHRRHVWRILPASEGR